MAGIIGHPLSHSYSPYIYEYLNLRFNKNIVYQKYDLNEREFNQFMQLLPKLKLDGLNVTLPYKQQIFKHINNVDPTLVQIKSCNTLKVNHGKKEIRAYNTDLLALMNLMKPHLKTVAKNRAIVLGAGGVSYTSVYALAKLGVKEIVIVNRSKANALKLITHFNGLFVRTHFSFLPLEKINGKAAPNLEDFDIIMNASTQGMKGFTSQKLPLKKMASKKHLVIEWVYNPLQTTLFKWAQKEKLLLIDGIDLLVEQATLNYEIWMDEKIRNKEVVSLELKNLCKSLSRLT